MISVKKISSPKEMKTFVKFPFSLYKHSKTWVPPIISDELAAFDSSKNPVFEYAEADFFLAYKDNQIVGRIAVIVNKYEISQGVKKIRFGWFDAIDDIDVTRALLLKVEEKARELQLEYMEGPMGFSNMDKVGVQTFGFEHIGGMMTWTNFPYYASHFEKLGMVKEKGYIESYFYLKNTDENWFNKMADIVEKRFQLRVAPIKSKEDIIPYVDEMFDLFNESYAKLASFIPVTQRQKDFFKEKYIPFVIPDFIKFILNKEGKIICFAIVMPSFSEALQKANGRLFPFGWWHLLRALKNPKTVDFYLIGITPEYQSKGVPALLFREYYKSFKQKGVEKCVLTPELEDNIAVQSLWKNFQPIDHCKRATYRRNISY